MSRAPVRSTPPQDTLFQLFVYEPDTGLLKWKVKPHRKATWIYPGRVAGTVHGNGYLVIRIEKIGYHAHRVIWKMQTGKDPVEEIDHRDGDKLNNKWMNLREASHGQNHQNIKLPKNNKSGVKGVHWVPDRKAWKASIDSNRKKRNLGLFKNLKDAAIARHNAEIALHGEFARQVEP